MSRRLGIVAFIAYVGTVFAANWAIERYGVVPVGFGLVAPAAVWFVGLAFTLREAVHETLGRGWVLVAIAVGAACSALVSPAFALASGVAFGVSEVCDWAVYERLRERNWLAGVALSNTVGLVIDSVVFLWLAFASFTFLPGQIVGKAWMTAAALILLGAARGRVLPRHP